MKTLVIGLDCAAPELLFGDERLTNIRRLMDGGCYGRLETIIPPITVPAWMCMATSQDPGSLGVYGFRNRSDYSYDGLSIVNSNSIQDLAIWDQIAREGKKSTIIGVPPSYPPRKVNGVCIGCFLTPDTLNDEYTRPDTVKGEIAKLVGEYPVDVKGFRTDRKDWLKDEIYETTRKHFEVVRHMMQNSEWDYFHFVEICLDRLQHGFWKFHDTEHVLHVKDNHYKDVITDYYLFLDNEIGKLLNLLDEDTAILVMSDHGAQRLDGGFCVNEWLIKEGLLVLNEYPKEITPLSKLSINWHKTKVWSEGGYYARVFLNVKGREPKGTINPEDYDKVRNEVKIKFEALPDDKGEPMGNLVFKPDEIYQNVNNIAPDLIVHFGELYWRSIGGVGYPGFYIQENDTGPDDCNHAQMGSFILASSNNPIRGKIEGSHILDMSPTLLEIGGYDIPNTMQGKSILSRSNGNTNNGDDGGYTQTEEEIIRDRLSGLGYIS